MNWPVLLRNCYVNSRVFSAESFTREIISIEDPFRHNHNIHVRIHAVCVCVRPVTLEGWKRKLKSSQAVVIRRQWHTQLVKTPSLLFSPVRVPFSITSSRRLSFSQMLLVPFPSSGYPMDPGSKSRLKGWWQGWGGEGGGGGGGGGCRLIVPNTWKYFEGGLRGRIEEQGHHECPPRNSILLAWKQRAILYSIPEPTSLKHCEGERRRRINVVLALYIWL